MSRRKFILLSIGKTWLISTVVSVILLILFLNAVREVREYPGRCDMSGLAYGFTVFWILFLSVLSFSSLFSLLQQLQGKIKTMLCWFLLPVIASVCSFFLITDGKIDSEEIILFLIMNLPWLVIWLFFYYRQNTRFHINND